MTAAGGPGRVLVLGGTGSIGRVVVERLGRGDLAVAVRVLARDADRARRVLGDGGGVDVVPGDVTDPGSLAAALADVDQVVMTHGAPYGSGAYDDVDYGAVPSLLEALDGREARVVLMSSIGVTGAPDGLLAWKRRGERLLRASGLPHAVVRPGWFDAGSGAEQRVDLRQGDGTGYGPVRREHVAEALVRALTTPEAVGRTVEVFSVDEPPVEDWGRTFAALTADTPGALDGALDLPGPPPDAEPARVRADLERWGRRGS